MDKQEEWSDNNKIDEFRHKFITRVFGQDEKYIGEVYTDIEDWIRNAFKLLRSKDRDTLIEKIGKMERINLDPMKFRLSDEDIGFNSALDTVKQIILETLK